MRYKQRKTANLYNYMGQRTCIEKFASQTSQRNTESISRERKGGIFNQGKEDREKLPHGSPPLFNMNRKTGLGAK